MRSTKSLEMLDWSLDAGQIKTKMDEALVEVNAKIDDLLKIVNKTFENSIKAMDRIRGELSDKTSMLTFPSYSSTSADVRKASSEATKVISDFYTDFSMREDIFNIFQEVNNKEKLEGVDKKLIEKGIRDFKRNGLGLPKDQREEFGKIKKELSKLGIDHSLRLNEENHKELFTLDELEGVPENVISSFKKDDDGNYIVGLSYPEVIPILQYAVKSKTRKKISIPYNMRGGAENTKRLSDAIKLRAKAAKMLNYKDHASFVIDTKMAKNPENVDDFLNDLIDKLSMPNRELHEKLIELKLEKEPDESNVLEPYDGGFYARLYKELNYDIDMEEVKKYFTLEKVMNGMFELYQDILSLKFKKVEAEVWHEDVEVYEVSNRKDDALIGRFYFDIFPREGKFGHAAAFSLIVGRALPDGEYQATVSALEANFNKPTDTAPSMLTHEQVITLFHEFGHIMHQLVTTASFIEFSGTSVATDFVEAPSQMLENWCWERDVLKMITEHVETKERIPDDLLDKMLAAKNALTPRNVTAQLFYGRFDMNIHALDEVDINKEWYDLREKITLTREMEGLEPVASFGHLMGGYDAGYYGYMWSKVYAQDMYTRFQELGVISEKAGALYRKWILEPGSSMEEMDLLINFLGREPNNQAFLKEIGL